jgi:hypothetical protein
MPYNLTNSALSAVLSSIFMGTKGRYESGPERVLFFTVSSCFLYDRGLMKVSQYSRKGPEDCRISRYLNRDNLPGIILSENKTKTTAIPEA